MSNPFGLMADLHLHAWSSFSKTEPSGLNSRLAGLLREIYRAAQVVHEAGGDQIIMAGDVFHVRGSVAPSVLNATCDTLYKCNLDFGTKFLIIPGNHDLEGKDSTRLGSAVTALEGTFVAVRNQTYMDEDTGVVMVPWFESIPALKAELEKWAPKEKGSWDAIIHAPIDGVIPGLPAHGLDPEYLASLGYRRVFAGHYHNHKRFEGGIYSIGALAHHTWSDVNTRAGFLLVTEKEVSWRKSHLPEFVDMTKLTEFEPEEIPAIVDKNYVRMRVEASKLKDVEDARAELIAMGAAGVLVQAEPKPPAEAVRATGHTIKSGASLEVSVTEFIKTMPSVDAAQVAAEALNVLGAVGDK